MLKYNIISKKKIEFKFLDLFFKKSFILNEFFYINFNSFYFYDLKKNLFFYKNNFMVLMLKNLFLTFYFNYLLKKMFLKTFFIFCNFSYGRIFLKVGLGFRKKYSLRHGYYMMTVGRRYAVIFKSTPSTFFFNVRRKNIFLFANTKKKLYYFLTHLRYMRKETLYKVKGIMTLNRIIFSLRISRSVVFARRVKFRKMKLKLTKKQKQRK